jgi:hypothetical protein
MVIPAGTLITLSTGEYSDYEVLALGRTVTELDDEALREEYLTLYPEQRTKYDFRVFQFVKWLMVDKRVLQEVDYVEWFLGGNGKADFGVSDGEKVHDLLKAYGVEV